MRTYSVPCFELHAYNYKIPVEASSKEEAIQKVKELLCSSNPRDIKSVSICRDCGEYNCSGDEPVQVIDDVDCVEDES